MARPWFMARQTSGPAYAEQLVLMRMLRGKLEIPLAYVWERAARLDGMEQILLGPHTQLLEQFPLVLKSLINRRRSGAGRPGHRAHGKCPFALLAPQAVGGIEDPAFQVNIRVARHLRSSGDPARYQ